MTRQVRSGPSASLAYDTSGSGMPLLAFHGAYSSRVEVRGFLEPVLADRGDRALRRVYVDLPGHGDSRPSSGFRSSEDVLDAVDLLLDAEVPEGPFLLLGHSYGGHFARAVAARHPDRVAGLALLCTVVPGELRPAASAVVRDDGVSAQLDDDQRAEYEGYFVVRTAATLERFRTAVVPAAGPVDDETLERAITTGPHVADPDAVVVDAPVLVLSGRRDRWVGWERQERLGDGDLYPHATVVTVADAGHALPHERPGLVGGLLGDWLERAGLGAADAGQERPPH
ncbi:alpha/beta fold hydrolase [Curtobacterium flaccumfaciens]|nr:alpha/beta hydrolase [Curtobacterium flaccumfaciens]